MKARRLAELHALAQTIRHLRAAQAAQSHQKLARIRARIDALRNVGASQPQDTPATHPLAQGLMAQARLRRLAALRLAEAGALAHTIAADTAHARAAGQAEALAAIIGQGRKPRRG